jgi:hypothetical protein
VQGERQPGEGTLDGTMRRASEKAATRLEARQREPNALARDFTIALRNRAAP